MQRTTILALKLMLGLLIAIIIAVQIFALPMIASQMASQFPEFSWFETPGLVIAEVFLVLVLISLVCVWRLLSFVRGATIFSQTSFIYVDVILLAITAATVLILGAFIFMSMSQIGSPAVAFLCVFGILLGISSALLVIVMRGLLRKACELETELSEVV